MKNGKTAFILNLMFLATSLAVTGCGGSAYRVTSSSKPMIVPGAQGAIPSPSSSSGATDDGTGDEDDSSTVITGEPAFNYQIQGTGYTSVSVKVQTNRILKVQFTPGTQDRTVEGTGFAPQYSQMGVYIKVGTQSQATEMLSNGLLGGSPEKSRILEFSNSFTRTCDRTDSSCRQEVTITVEKPNYDYFCLINWKCPWTQVWETHPWTGTLLIQTDDTDGLSTN